MITTVLECSWLWNVILYFELYDGTPKSLLIQDNRQWTFMLGTGCPCRVTWELSSVVLLNGTNVSFSDLTVEGRWVSRSGDLKRKETVGAPREHWGHYCSVYWKTWSSFWRCPSLHVHLFFFSGLLHQDFLVLARMIDPHDPQSGHLFLEFPWESTCCLALMGTWYLIRQQSKEHEG